MLPADDSLAFTCPFCGKEKRLMDLVSGNTYGAELWSDNKRITPMLPEISYVQKCPHCGKYYITERQTAKYVEGNSYDTGFLTFPEMKEAFAQLSGEGFLNKKEEANVRMMLHHAYNDYYYRSEEKRTILEEDAALFRENGLWLIKNHIIDVVLKAEFYREIGDMEAAKNILESFVAEDDFRKQIVTTIREKIGINSCEVFKITAGPCMENNNHSVLPEHIIEALSSECLSDTERMSLIYETTGWHSYVDERLQYRDYQMPENAEESIDTLVEWYVNKKSRRVSYAGKKLCDLFQILPPVEKRKVGLALLTGSKTDTEWICRRLDNQKLPYREWIINWHPCYYEKIEEVWNKYHGTFCGRLLVQFGGIDMVRRNIGALQQDDDIYFRLCRRLVNEDWFKIDANRLAACTTIDEYLSVMSRTAGGISSEEAEKLLYQWVAVVAGYVINGYFRSLDWATDKPKKSLFWKYEKEEHRVIYAWGIDTALYYLLKMKKYDVVKDFLKWDQHVYDIYYSQLDRENDSIENRAQFAKTIVQNLPERYKYLSSLNDCYQCVNRSGKPLTIPTFRSFYKIYTGMNESENKVTEEDISHSAGKRLSEEEAHILFKKYPNLQLLAEKMGLEFQLMKGEVEAVTQEDEFLTTYPPLALDDSDLPF